ncbi:hypothetical protein D3C87_2164920 [compost metagenome]
MRNIGNKLFFGQKKRGYLLHQRTDATVQDPEILSAGAYRFIIKINRVIYLVQLPVYDLVKRGQ